MSRPCPRPTFRSAASPPIPTHAELFLAFFKITLSGFGGTLPWTRRMFVEEKRWMTAEEFNDVYALCQFLPGPNIVNLTAVFGSRMRGPTGALAAWSGFLLLPFCVMLAVGVLYERYGDVEARAPRSDRHCRRPRQACSSRRSRKWRRRCSASSDRRLSWSSQRPLRSG